MNIPLPEFENLFASDPVGKEMWRHWMGPQVFSQTEKHFSDLGEAGALASPLSARADQLSPILHRFSPDGRLNETVEFHPDYRRLEELSYGRNIIGIKFDRKFLEQHKSIRHLVGFGSGFYFAQTEMGLYCPICMTDGVARVLEHNAAPELAKEVIDHLASNNLADLWQGSMYLTEKQGGSDVGVGEVEARHENGKWFLRGDKWFCSNVTADCILALARMPEKIAGTKGLGLFLVLRKKPHHNSKSIRIHRIKNKLGVRSMATGEITFEDTQAFLIGGVDAGFKMMAEMLNLSRLYNSVAAIAATRRAAIEALAYGRRRKAFGAPLTDLALWRSAMSDLLAEYWGMFALVFETVRFLDQADCGSKDARKLTRLCIPMIKAMSSKFSIFAVSECMEQIGGNAYIEESILPRLLRDCQVLPIWEGTSHILTLDCLRALVKEDAAESFFARIELALKTYSGFSQEFLPDMQIQVGELKIGLHSLLSSPPALQSRDARDWIEQASRTLSQALLLELANNPALRKLCLSAFARRQARPFATSPVNTGRPSRLLQTEEILLGAEIV